MSASAEQVRIREVGPRDGFQNEPETVATADKVRLIELLARTGLRRLEVTSFVRADVIPQLADAREVLEAMSLPPEVAASVLIPNERGLENALSLRERPDGTSLFDEINVFLSASETHNGKNVNRSVAESLAGVERVIARAREAGLRCEGVVAVAFGCPYEGEVLPGRTLGLAERLAAAGCAEVGFGDTTGMANPRQVGAFFAAARERLGDEVELTAHFHNTRGQGLANRARGARRRRALLRVVVRGAGWVPGSARRHGQPRHRGSGVHAARDGLRDRRGSRRAREGQRGPAGARTAAGKPCPDRRAGRLAGWPPPGPHRSASLGFTEGDGTRHLGDQGLFLVPAV